MLRSFLPKTLFWRVLLLFVISLVVLQFVVVWIFFDRHWDNITWRLSSLAAGDISYVVHQFEHADISDRAIILGDAASFLDLSIGFKSDSGESELAGSSSPLYQDAPLELLSLKLSQSIDNDFYINAFKKTIEVIVETSDGYLFITFAKKRIFSSTIYVFLLVTLLSLIILLVFAVVMIRNQVMPILRLAQTADAFGKGQREGVGVLKPRGAAEIRLATVAFNRMQERIHRQIRQRTDMLAGVSHDLRTVITRMKLELALLSESSVTKTVTKDLGKDLKEMEGMIESYLTFAEGEGSERSVECDLGDLLLGLVEAWRKQGVSIDFHAESVIELPVKVVALGRCFNNLVGNAVRYGERIDVRLGIRDSNVQIVIDDDGEGIPESERERVFRPFYRLEKSRSKDTGGYGLGLAIARDIARVHGGDVILDDSPQGGTRAIILLPL